MRIKKISPTTPANGNIENQYGTSQTNAYSEAYANNTFATKDTATTSANGLMSTSDKSKLDNFNLFVTTIGTDLNDYKTPGIYAFEGTSVTPANIPAGVNGWLVVMRSGETGVGVKQLFFRYGTANSNDWQMWVRTLHGGNTWSNWFKLTTSYTSVGEVSYNTTVLDTPYANSIVRNGNIVQINFIAQIKAASSGNWDIVTNLPPNVSSNERYVAYKGSSQYLPNAGDTPMIIWPQVNNTSLRIGSVSNSDIGKYIYFNVTYISTEPV